MTKEKARKHLERAKETREFWRNFYVDNERDICRNLDVYISYYGCTGREKTRRECIEHIKEQNERISRFERIIK